MVFHFFFLYFTLWNFYWIVFNSIVFLNCVESSDESIEGIHFFFLAFPFDSCSFYFSAYIFLHDVLFFWELLTYESVIVTIW